MMTALCFEMGSNSRDLAVDQSKAPKLLGAQFENPEVDVQWRFVAVDYQSITSLNCAKAKMTEFKDLKYAELRKLAKAAGIKANQKVCFSWISRICNRTQTTTREYCSPINKSLRTLFLIWTFFLYAGSYRVLQRFL